MGCASSKLDDLPAVALCRDRFSHLDEAIRHRYALAEAHMAYITALKGVAHSMHVFLDSNLDSSPVLNLPNQRKGDPVDPGPGRLSNSDSGSHLHFHYDEDSDGSGSGHSSPLHFPTHHNEYMNPNPEEFGGLGPFQGGFLHSNYMKKTAAAPTVVYEQRPMSHETVRFGESSSSYYPYPYPSSNPAAPYPYYGYAGNYSGGIGGGGGYSHPSPAIRNSPYPAAPSAHDSSSKKPPSPPRSSGWDEFLNPFKTSYGDQFYEQYTPGRHSRELREEEGIPDLEEEDYQHEVVKEVPKFIDTRAKSVAVDDDSGGYAGGEASVPPEENNETKYEVRVVDNNVADAKKSEEQQGGNSTEPKIFNGVNEVVKEIELQFEKASESGNEIATLLEVGKFPYRRRRQVASKMVQAITPPLSVVSPEASTSMAADPSEASGPAYLEEAVGRRSTNLSSTLHKLYLWEKKLYNEVKAEEKMRIIHDRKVQKLKRLEQRGAEAAKVDAARAFIRNLSTKMRIAIQVVDKISITINKIRDEELWPQLNEFIQGLNRMWRCMLECHRIQCQAIGSSRGLGSIGSGKTLTDSHLEATLQFEAELINWTSRFAIWVNSQKSYIKSLNRWLSKCLLYEPEETPDGTVPFSPGRLSAPLIFVICNQWAQSLDTVSEKEVVEAMRVLVASVLQMWRQDKHEMRERMLGNKEMEKKVKNLDKKDLQIQKEVRDLEKKVVLFTGINDEDDGLLPVTDQGQAVYPGDASRDLQKSLQKIFQAMEKFMNGSSKVYEDLLQRCEEEQRSAS